MKRVELSEERLAVIDNIADAVSEGDLFRKVELHDPTPTDEDIKRVIVPFDTLRKKPKNRIKANIARVMAALATRAINNDTEIVGIENALSVTGGAIITSNHFNPMDNTAIRYMCMKCKRARGLHIVVQESNIFMKGLFGFLMRNCYTLPVSQSLAYMSRNLKPALKEILSRGDTVLIYPEQEMWYNYKKPRDARDGAYYYAAALDVPVIPCFIEMTETDGKDSDGMNRVKYTVHVMPPIYPDSSLPMKQRWQTMRARDLYLKRECYKSCYGEYPTPDFDRYRDIAGYPRD